MKTSAMGATAIGVGFVAASEPVMAAAIETDFKGLKAGEEMIPVGSFQMPAYVSRPEKAKGSLPIIIVVSEIFGVHEYIAGTEERQFITNEAQIPVMCINPATIGKEGSMLFFK
jgi:carboxymethylenebutenolidase